MLTWKRRLTKNAMPTMSSRNSSAVPLSILRRTILQCTQATRKPCLSTNRFCTQPTPRTSHDGTIIQQLPIQLQCRATQTGKTHNYEPQRTKTHRHCSGTCHSHRLLNGLIQQLLWRLSRLDNGAWDVMALFAFILTASILTHEIAHKIIAQKAGMWAEFRLTTWGAVLTLISVFLPFKMIAPGAMMIAGTPPTAKRLVKNIHSRVITNMIYAVVFLGLGFAFISSPYAAVLLFAAYINAFMAIFNLLPFGILDGYKVFSLNKWVWVAAFIPSIVLTIFTYWLLLASRKKIAPSLKE